MRAVNLIPSEARSRGGSTSVASSLPTYLLLGVLAIGVAFVTLYVLSNNSISQRKAQLTSLQAEVAQAQAQSERLGNYSQFATLAQSRADTVRGLATARFNWYAALVDLSKVVPANTSLQTLNGSTTGVTGSGTTPAAAASASSSASGSSAPAFELTGCTKSQDDVARLMTRLRLINGASEEQIWNETVSLKEPATAPEQMRASRTAMEHVRNRLFEVEMQRATVAGERATTPMDYVLRARAMAKADKTLERFTRQEALCEEALRLNPDFVPALLCVSYTLDGQLDVDSKVDRERLIRRMDEVTNRAVNLNRGAAECWNARSGALMYMGRWDAALEASATAIQLDPDAAWLVAARAWSMSMVGRPDEAVALVTQAIAMDPPGEWWTIRAGCEAHLLLGQYEEAIATCEKAAGRAGEDFDIAYFLAAAYAHTGATARAAEETAKILRRSPGFTIAKLRAKGYSINPEYMRLAEAHWYTGLRKAGIPEQ